MRWKWTFLTVLLLLALIQVVPVHRTNPEVVEEMEAPSDVQAVLRSSCYDCHSNETHWPWYAYVAPSSWLVVHDVSEAREHLNFSEWNRFRNRESAIREEIREEVEKGEMPLWYYLPLHPEARLSPENRSVLLSWAGERRPEQD